MEATKRTGRDAYFQVSYVHSKNLGSLGTATRTNFPGEAIGPGVTDRYNTRYDRGDLSGARRDRFLLTGIFPLSFGKRPRLRGWELSTVTLLQSGPFLTPTIATGLDRSNTNLAVRAAARPDRIGNGNLSNPTPDRYFDRNAFVPVPNGAGRFGNSGAGVLVGPGTAAVAAGIAKTFALSERIRLRLEATFTNILNHPNFAPPNTNISSPLFGRLTTVQSAENSGNRVGQLGARIDF